MEAKNKECSKLEDSVRKKTSILRRSVTEPKLSNGRDRSPIPLFTRRFTVPNNARNIEYEPQSSGYDSSKANDGSSKRRSWIRNRLFKQQSVGVLQGWEESSESPEPYTRITPSKDPEIRCTSRVNQNNIRPKTSERSMKPLDDCVLPSIENINERVPETWASSRRETNQRKSVQIETTDSIDRLSRMSISSRRCYSSLDVHTVLEYTTHRMDNLFAAKHYDATELAMLRQNSMESVTPSSREYSLVIEQLNGESEINNNNNNNNNQETKHTVGKKSRKRWNNLKTKFRAKNAFVRSHSVKDMQSKVSVENINTDMIRVRPKVPMSRGWLIVKDNLSQIAEMAPPESYNSKPMLNIRHLAQLVKAKEFKLLMKRRASFVENGKFKYEEAKADLFSRYPIPSAVEEHIIADDGDETRQRTSKRRNCINTVVFNIDAI